MTVSSGHVVSAAVKKSVHAEGQRTVREYTEDLASSWSDRSVSRAGTTFTPQIDSLVLERTYSMRPSFLHLKVAAILIAVCVGCERIGIRVGPRPLPSAVPVKQGIELSESPKFEARSQPAESTQSDPPSGEQQSTQEFSTQEFNGAPLERAPAAKQTGSIRPFATWTLQETVADSLVRIGGSTVPELVHSLRNGPTQDHEQLSRLELVEILAKIGPDAKLAVPTLVQLLRDPDSRVRVAAVRALGQIGPDAASAVPELIELLKQAE